MADSFDIFEQPFVTWRRGDGTSDCFGLKSLLADAGALSPFGDAGSQTTFAVIRVLLVLMHRTRPTCDDGEWQRLWDAGRFPDDWLAEIEKAAAGKFDLFQKRPFLQTAPADEDTRPVADLIAELPADTNINHARHTYDDRTGLCPACCAVGLIRLAPFCGQGGQGKAPSINAPPPVYLLPVGDTLFRTLLLNWPRGEPVRGDRAAWQPGTGGGRDRIGLLEGFTWEPRSVRLLPELANGDRCTLCGAAGEWLVRRTVFQKGRDRRDPRVKEWRDPHVAYDEEAGGSKVRTLLAPEPVQDPRAAAGFWRKLAAALLGAEQEGFRCSAVAAAREHRPGEPLSVLAVLTHTRQAKVLHDRSDRWTLPPLDAGQVQLLRDELAWIEEALTNWAARTVAEEGPVPEIAPLTTPPTSGWDTRTSSTTCGPCAASATTR
jgi:CRISPR type I-E-associated protein CasA/Cse1